MEVTITTSGFGKEMEISMTWELSSKLWLGTATLSTASAGKMYSHQKDATSFVSTKFSNSFRTSDHTVRRVEQSKAYIAGMIVAANTYISDVHFAEFEISNNTQYSDRAQRDIAVIADGITKHLSLFEA
ncbi:hypothetical protein KCU92_g7564, partial [Aureobasidium melanogenum]|jgi:glutaredoxin 2